MARSCRSWPSGLPRPRPVGFRRTGRTGSIERRSGNPRPTGVEVTRSGSVRFSQGRRKSAASGRTGVHRQQDRRSPTAGSRAGTRPARPARQAEWIVQLGIGTGCPLLQVHAGDCYAAGNRHRPVDRNEARRLLASGLSRLPPLPARPRPAHSRLTTRPETYGERLFTA
ncbi:DUF6233 domain-containing protein [Streptomyces sp. NPDC000070]|uniref:DUF6233 domain-containing protein n=1 Tax=Streptomyces sp. NPDC000070 TaxID=3154240 RepID=UPI00332BDE23